MSFRPYFIVGVFAMTACGSESGPSGPPSVVGAVGVAAGGAGSCAVGSSGGLACWGAIPDGTPLDTGATADVLGAETISVPIDIIGIALRRTAGDGNTGCIVGSDHQVYCWGSLMYGNEEQSIGVGIQPLVGATSAVSVAMDRPVICATRTDNGVRCFGSFFGGGRGTDSVDVSNAGPQFSLIANGLSPSQAAFGTAVGFMFGCAIRTDSLVACWGTRHRGQLGGAVTDSTLDCSPNAPPWCQRGPAPVAGGHKYRQISAQWDHACATLIAGGVECWGRKFGAATVGDWWTTCSSAADCVNTPTAVALPASAIRVGVGFEHACALVNTGDIFCWGKNDRGQLGRTGADSDTPVKVSGGYLFTSLSVGQDHTCALKAGSGAIGCWGANDHGQLGDGTTTDRDHPVAVVVAE